MVAAALATVLAATGAAGCDASRSGSAIATTASQQTQSEVAQTLDSLRRVRALSGYPPLVETSGHLVAQAEHTLYVGEDRVEVVTL